MAFAMLFLLLLDVVVLSSATADDEDGRVVAKPGKDSSINSKTKTKAI
jgi:hypothetical protein